MPPAGADPGQSTRRGSVPAGRRPHRVMALPWWASRARTQSCHTTALLHGEDEHSLRSAEKPYGCSGIQHERRTRPGSHPRSRRRRSRSRPTRSPTVSGMATRLSSSPYGSPPTWCSPSWSPASSPRPSASPKWANRYCRAAMTDRSSRPDCSPRRCTPTARATVREVAPKGVKGRCNYYSRLSACAAFLQVNPHKWLGWRRGSSPITYLMLTSAHNPTR